MDFNVPRMTPDELKQFIIDVVDNKIFTSAHMTEQERKQHLQLVFMPVALGALSGAPKEVYDAIGILWEYYRDALPMGVNGMPIFASCRIMWKEDWILAREKITKLQEKRKQEKDEIDL